MPSNLVQAKNGRYGANRDLKTGPISREELEAMISPQASVVPEGWFTLAQYQEAWGVSKPVVCDRLMAAIKNGCMEKKKFRARTRTNSMRLIPHYRIKQAA